MTFSIRLSQTTMMMHHLFKIDSLTGEVNLLVDPDFEDRLLLFTVIASDPTANVL